MAGKGSMTAWIAGGAVALLLAVPAPARACEAHQAAAKASAEAKLDAEVKEAVQQDSAPQQAAPQDAARKSTTRQPELLAEKCKCDGPSTCTCQKGKCACSKCGGKSRYRMMESLRDRPGAVERKERRNAAAGTFI